LASGGPRLITPHLLAREAESAGLMRILFVTATRIGDAVLSTGLLSHLVERHPTARFTIAAGPDAAPLFDAVPGLERIVIVKKQTLARHWLALFRRVALKRWDIVVDLRGSALAYLLSARQRRVIGKGDPAEHRVRQLARLFDLDPAPAPRLWTSAEHERRAVELVPPGPPVLAIGPAANWRGKQWRAERFAALAQRLMARSGPFRDGRVAVLAAAHERGQAAPVLAALPAERCLDLVGRTDLLTAAAALRRCALFIGNDTGIMHIAAAMGTPTLGLFGPSLPEHYAPWGTRTAVVRTAESYAEIVGRPDYDHRTTDTQMDSLSVDAAESAARRLWASIAGEAA
jgi:heptosyltransferase-3